MDKPIKLFDGGGVFLSVQPNGSRWWRFKYRFQGKERTLSLGVYPYVPLKLARTRRDEARKMVADGADPSAERKAAQEAHIWLGESGVTDTPQSRTRGLERLCNEIAAEFLVPRTEFTNVWAGPESVEATHFRVSR